MIVFIGAYLPEQGPVEIRFDSTGIQQVGVPGSIHREGAQVIDLKGRYVVPAFIDAHVHLALFPRDRALADAGVAAAIDWGAPLARITRPSPHLRRLDAGPLLTAVGGYPTQTWGRNGYGLEVSGTGEQAVNTVLRAGATVVKVAIAGTPSLTDEQLHTIVSTAHRTGHVVGAHALGSTQASRAYAADVDVLVHTPTESLDPGAIDAWKTRVVVSTLAAFGASDAAIDNLHRLHVAGATVLYGTDLGNSRDPSIQCAEIEAMQRAGLNGRAILAAGTEAPARVFGLQSGIEAGKPASMLVLSLDPLKHPSTLCQPASVWLRGRQRGQ